MPGAPLAVKAIGAPAAIHLKQRSDGEVRAAAPVPKPDHFSTPRSPVVIGRNADRHIGSVGLAYSGGMH